MSSEMSSHSGNKWRHWNNEKEDSKKD
jgi:hypothetical protein